jgi:hypothetical protein
MVRKFRWLVLVAAGTVFMPFAGLQADHMGGGMGKGGGMGQGGPGMGSQGMGSGGGGCPMHGGGMGSGMGQGKGMGKGGGGAMGKGGGGMGGQNMTAQTQQLLQMNMMRSTLANQATIQQSRMVGDVQQNIRNQFAYQAAVKKAIQQANNQRKTGERNSESLGFAGAPPGLGN